MVNINVIWTEGADQDLGLPTYETLGSAGADLRANFPIDLRGIGIRLGAHQRALIPTGLCMEIPYGYEVQIRPRSGLALKHGLTLPNSPGTIDSDYRGEVGVIVLNTSTQDIHISHGDRIAQMVVAPVIQAKFVQAQNLSKTDRGAEGFGSTGTS